MYYNKNNFPVLILNIEASNIELEVCDHPPYPQPGPTRFGKEPVLKVMKLESKHCTLQNNHRGLAIPVKRVITQTKLKTEIYAQRALLLKLALMTVHRQSTV